MAADPPKKPVIIGLYGLPGCGKSYTLEWLKNRRDTNDFLFFEGSEVINKIVPDGLEAFQSMPAPDKVHWREQAIEQIRTECITNGKSGIVTGHFMLWSAAEDLEPVHTSADWLAYTHVIYLGVPIDVLFERREKDRKKQDGKKDRPILSKEVLENWQLTEISALRSITRSNGALFLLARCEHQLFLPVLLTTILDFSSHDEQLNQENASHHLDKILSRTTLRMTHLGVGLKSILTIDADKTLAAQDTGSLFWQKVSHPLPGIEKASDTLKDLFSSQLGYSYTAFRQATCLYEEAIHDRNFDEIYEEIASEVTLYPEMKNLISKASNLGGVGVVVVTCGLPRVWEKVLARAGISDVEVIGGNTFDNGYVINAAVKGKMVDRLRQHYHTNVMAFGDSPLDMDMLTKANTGVVVVGKEDTRSNSMDLALQKAIEKGGCNLYQALIPRDVPRRLDEPALPVVDITKPEFLDVHLSSPMTPSKLDVHLPKSENAAKLLATPMRDSAVSGPALREVHRRAGWYLSVDILTDILGLEEVSIQHVLDRPTKGSCVLDEQKSTIVAMMRGGEPMAYGVSDALPRAMFVHAKEATDLKPHHLSGQSTVILVDSVVNTGKSMIEFVKHALALEPYIRIVMVAGVVQDQCLSTGSLLRKELAGTDGLHLVALRLSSTKFTGSGTTDTGNRLFNTTHLL